jgi:hypothetical protein
VEVESIAVKEYDKINDRKNDKYRRNMILAGPHPWDSKGKLINVLFYVDLLADERPFSHFHEKLSFPQPIAISLFAEVHFQILNADWIPVRDIGNVAVTYFVTVNDDHQTAANRFHFVAFKDEHTRVFA